MVTAHPSEVVELLRSWSDTDRKETIASLKFHLFSPTDFVIKSRISREQNLEMTNSNSVFQSVTI